ncbi:MAG: hypothetical protein HYY84_16490 [Deltaproteobacteria bacterium]|nr:hypothetical protein [Deltaproteobacteria bacterium]
MKLSLLLLALGIKLKLSSIASAGFRRHLRTNDFVLVIRTEALPGRARSFQIRGGRIKSRRGRDESADTELVWCDADTAVRAMLSSNELDVFSAIGRSQVRILGNLSYALHFMDMAK